jgi:hypothetical protein
VIYVICVFAGLFVALSFAMLYVSYRERHVGMLLMGVTYGTSGMLAITLPHWWPLIVGFVLVWMLRLLGLEPGQEPAMHEGAGVRDEGEERRDEVTK